MSLYATEIYDILKADEFSKTIFKAVLARNELPSKVTFPSAYIINNKNNNHPGEHWIAFFYDENGNVDFFDSFARGPSAYGLTKYFLKTSKSINYNKIRLQSFFSEYCGYHAIYFILLRSRTIPLSRIENFFYDKKDVNINDFRISFINKY
jgi:hypothetical protein